MSKLETEVVGEIGDETEYDWAITLGNGEAFSLRDAMPPDVKRGMVGGCVRGRFTVTVEFTPEGEP